MTGGIRKIKDKNRVKRAQVQHARTRGLERYGAELSAADLVRMVGIIQDPAALPEHRRFVCRKSNRITVFQVRLDGDWYNVCYDSRRKTIATLLPKDAREAQAFPVHQEPNP